MTEIRTEKLVADLVEGVQRDLESITSGLKTSLALIQAVEGAAKGVNGLSSFLRGQAQHLTKMIEDIEDESNKVRKKFLGEGKLEIIERTSSQGAKEV